MLEQKHINESLAKVMCSKCGTRMDGSEFIPISEAPVAIVAHVVCAKCQAQSVVTITPTGTGIVPLVSDLVGSEIKKFLGKKSITYDEILDLHKDLKGKKIWKLLHKKEKYLGKNQKAIGAIEKSQL